MVSLSVTPRHYRVIMVAAGRGWNVRIGSCRWEMTVVAMPAGPARAGGKGASWAGSRPKCGRHCWMTRRPARVHERCTGVGPGSAITGWGAVIERARAGAAGRAGLISLRKLRYRIGRPGLSQGLLRAHRNPASPRHGGRSPQEFHGRNGTLRYTCYAR